jgi:hypothetical protein
MGIPMIQVAKRCGHSHGAISCYRNRMPQQLKAVIVGAALRPGIGDL